MQHTSRLVPAHPAYVSCASLCECAGIKKKQNVFVCVDAPVVGHGEPKNNKMMPSSSKNNNNYRNNNNNNGSSSSGYGKIFKWG